MISETSDEIMLEDNENMLQEDENVILSESGKYLLYKNLI